MSDASVPPPTGSLDPSAAEVMAPGAAGESVRWISRDPLIGLAAFAAALIASVIGQDLEVFTALMFWEWHETRPLSMSALVFWSCGLVGGGVMVRDRKEQARNALRQQAAWEVFRETRAKLEREAQEARESAAALQREQREAKKMLEEAQERADELQREQREATRMLEEAQDRAHELQREQREATRMLEEARESAAALQQEQRVASRMLEEAQEAARLDRELRSAEEGLRRVAETEHRRLLEHVKDLNETLPPSTILEEHSNALELAMNLLTASLRTQREVLDTAMLNDRIRTVLFWMTELVRLYLTKSGVPRAVFGAHVSLYFDSMHHLLESGWKGTMLPWLEPDRKLELLASIPELSSRLDGHKPASRDPLLQPCAWPVALGRGNDGQRVWVPGPQEAFMKGVASHYDDVLRIGEWARGKPGVANSIAWRKVEAYCTRQNGCGIRSLVSYPLVQYHADGRRLPLGALTVYATAENMIGRDVRADRLESLLVPFRVIITELLVRRAQLDETRRVRYARTSDWHDC